PGVGWFFVSFCARVSGATFAPRKHCTRCFSGCATRSRERRTACNSGALAAANSPIRSAATFHTARIAALRSPSCRPPSPCTEGNRDASEQTGEGQLVAWPFLPRQRLPPELGGNQARDSASGIPWRYAHRREWQRCEA